MSHSFFVGKLKSDFLAKFSCTLVKQIVSYGHISIHHKKQHLMRYRKIFKFVNDKISIFTCHFIYILLVKKLIFDIIFLLMNS